MKKFFKKLFYFSLPIILISYPFDYILSYYLSQSNEYTLGEFEVWNDIYNAEADCDIAIYGSSRAWVHFDPKTLRDSLGLNVYNFGLDGHNFWLQYLRHLEFIKYNKRPRTIILSIDAFTLQKRKDLYQSDQFLPYMLWNSNIQKYTSSFIGYRFLDYYIPLIRYAGKSTSLEEIIKNIRKDESSIRFRQNGYLGMDREWNTDLDKAKEKQNSYQVDIDSNTIQLLEQFIQDCSFNEIELVLVYSPEHIDGQNFITNRDQIIKIFNDFSTKYSLIFLDYSNDSLCFDKKYYYNATHLNKKGSEIFSRKLVSELNVRSRSIFKME